jgi:hypothetical protein
MLHVALASASPAATMTWTRRIGITSLDTRQYARQGRLVERSGPGTVEFVLRVDDGALLYEQAGCRFLQVPLPRRSAPQVRAASGADRRRLALSRSSSNGGVISCAGMEARCGRCSDIMTVAIWLLFVQALLGAFDTLYYHEYRLGLPHGQGTSTELRLHAARDFAYALIIGTLGFLTWTGTWRGYSRRC